MTRGLICSAFLASALCLLPLQGCKQSVRAGENVSESSKPYVLLLVFTDPRCGACRRDKPIVDSMRGEVNMIFLGWSDRDRVKHYNVRRVPTYILLTDEGYGRLVETWRTRSAAVARDRLGFSP